MYFDETCRFVSNEQKKAEGAKRDNEVLLQRQRPGEVTTVPYRVIDNPSKLTPDDWYENDEYLFKHLTVKE